MLSWSWVVGGLSEVQLLVTPLTLCIIVKWQYSIFKSTWDDDKPSIELTFPRVHAYSFSIDIWCKETGVIGHGNESWLSVLFLLLQFNASHSNVMHVTRKQTLRSLSYQKKDGCGPLFENIIYHVSRVKFWKVGVVPKEGWARPCVPVLLFVWQWQRS